MICRVGGIRTHDLQHPMLARYLATLQPENGAKIVNIFDFRIIECVIVYVADLLFGKVAILVPKSQLKILSLWQFIDF